MDKITKKGRAAILWLAGGHFVSDTYGGFINPLMPFIAAKLGFTMAVATIVVAITQICSNMLQPLFGYIADNIIKRFFIFWGLILASLFIPFAAAAPNVYLLTIFMILGCLGESFYHPQSLGLINLFSKNEKYSSNMGLYVSLGIAGFALGPLLATYLAQTIGLNKMPYTSILGLVFASCMFLFVPKLTTVAVKPEPKAFINSFKEILANSQMRFIMIIAMMKAMIMSSSCILLPFLWKSMGYKPLYIGVALFLFVFVGAIGALLSPFIEKRIGTKQILYFSMWATFPMMLLFAYIYKTMPIASMVLFGIIGFTTSLAQPVTLVLAQKALPQYKSIVSGFVNGFCWGIIALFLSVLGSIAENFGIMNVLIVLSLIPAICSYYIKFLKDC